MKKWADYLISEVAYDLNNLISVAKVHQDTDQGISKGELEDRSKIISNIKNGLSYITIYSGKNSWIKGREIHIFSIDGNSYLRIDKNKAKLDHLGDLSEPLFEKLQSVTKSEPEPAQPSGARGSLPKESAEDLPQELDLAPEPEPAQPSGARGSLPKESAEDLPQELDLAPEPEPAQPSGARGSLPKESAEDLPQELDLAPEPEPAQPSGARGSLPKESAEDLPQELDLAPEPEPAQPSGARGSLPKESAEDLPQELDLAPEPEPAQPSGARGSLPKESAEDLPQELDLAPEPEPAQPSGARGSLPKESAEDLPQELDLAPENHHQKLTQLNYLQQQIDELKHMISSELLHGSRSEKEYGSNNFFKIDKLIDVESFEENKYEHEIIHALLNQNKKLDDLEKKFHNLNKNNNL